MSNKSFVHLHVHADGSKLDGLAQVKKLVPAVEALGMPAIAITDHGSMSATYDLHKATKDSVVKPIYGIEAYIAPESRTLKEPVFWNEGGGNDVSGKGAYTHMTLLASTDEGLHNLFHLSSQAYLDGFYRHPRMDDELLEQYGKGIIATTGCPSGAVQTWLRIGNYDKALEAAAKYRDIFGKENYFVELMDHGLGIEKEVIPQLMSIAKDLGLGTVATNDTHYIHKDDSAVHDALLCIGSGSKLQEKDRFSFEGSEFYIKSPEEMRSIWDDYAPDACDNTLLIAERCTAAFGDGKDLMPEFPVPEGETESTLLDKEVKRGLESRYPDGIPEDRLKQAEYEVGIINQMGFPGYFLVTADFINWAKEQGIRVGPGRGCLSKDSNILTPLGFKKISDIEVGDEVYDEKGAVVKVPAIFEYDCDEHLVEIKGSYGGNGNKMTADHKVLVSKARKVTGKQKLAQEYRFEPDYAEPIWVRADEVEVGDLVVTPKLLVKENIKGWEYEQISESATNPKYEHSIRNSIKDADIARSALSKYYQDPSKASSITRLKTKEYFETHVLDLDSELSKRYSTAIAQSDYVYADYDFGMLLGIFISDGWLRSNGRDSVGFAQRTSEDELLIPSLIQKVFGLTASSVPNKQKDVTSYTINHKGIAQLFRNIFPDYALASQTKYIPEKLFQTSESFRRGLLEGLWYGDGSHEENESKYTTESRQLAQGVFQLLGTLGLPAGIKSSKQTDNPPSRESEWVEHSVVTAHNFDTSTLIMGKPFDGKFTYYRVREINIVPPEGKVYDFTVPTTNSYVTDSYVVHNSAAGSIVAYAMGITDIDPMKHGLMFERFLNPERVSMPDIDVDFDDRRRGEVIQYVIDKYGEDKVANIATFGTIKAKAAIKDAARVLSMPYMLGDKLTKVYPQPIVGRDLSLKDAYDPSNDRYDDAKEFRQLVENDPDAKETVELAKGLEGVRRGFGMHAAGVIMSRRPLVETVPLMRRDTNSQLMTQFEYPTCEYLGLLKMDFLGLSNLGTIDEALRLIKQNKGVEVDLDAISETLDDKKTYEMVARGETLGVFQLDSPPMRSLLETMVPDSFEDISAVLALYRPGPMGAGSHIEYAERKNGRRPITPIHPELEAVLEPILGETYGLCVTGETLIWDAKSGKRVRIDSIKDSVENGEFYTFGVNEEGVTSEALVSHFILTGVKKVLQISTRSGHSIRLSEDHPMLTPRGWVNAGELISGVDRLAAPSVSGDGEYLPADNAPTAHLENYGSSEDFFYANQNWTIIDEIKEDGFDEMYDITVEGIHNFLANGLVAHNCIYQEQVMAIAQQLAGYTLGQADLLRRAMGKKDPAVLAKEFIPFKDGMAKNGYSEESIQALWDILVPFSDYAFNRAHTAGYGLVSYWTAYLKANYPAEYMAALLTTNSDNKDKLALYLAECRYQQIEVLPPDINESELNYTAVGDSIRVGLIGVKNLGEKAIKAWIEEREKDGPAKNFTNFLERATTGIGTKRVVESIIKAGVFDSFPENRASLFAVVDDAIAAAKKNKKLKEKSADSLFDADEFALKLDIPELPEWEKMELLAMEREVLGLYVSDHPLADYQSAIESLSSTSIADLKQRDNPPQGQLKLAALVTNIDRKTTRKAGDPWALVTVEDMDASLNLYVFPKTYADARELLEVDKILLFTGKVEKRDDGSTNFIVQSVSTPDMQAVSRKVNRREERLERGDLTPEEAAALASATTIADDGLDSPVVIRAREAQLTLTLVERLKDAIIEYQGSRPVHIEVTRADHSKALYVLGDEFKVVGAAQFAAEVRSLFGPDAI